MRPVAGMHELALQCLSVPQKESWIAASQSVLELSSDVEV